HPPPIDPRDLEREDPGDVAAIAGHHRRIAPQDRTKPSSADIYRHRDPHWLSIIGARASRRSGSRRLRQSYCGIFEGPPSSRLTRRCLYAFFISDGINPSGILTLTSPFIRPSWSHAIAASRPRV